MITEAARSPRTAGRAIPLLLVLAAGCGRPSAALDAGAASDASVGGPDAALDAPTDPADGGGGCGCVHGECVATTDPAGANEVVCLCAPGFTGAACDQCASGYTGASCDACATGYEGPDCQRCATGYAPSEGRCVDVGCVDIPCGPHGQCRDVDGDGTGECACEPGWSGRSCEDCLPDHVLVGGSCVPDACASMTCGHGTCVGAGSTASCTCDRGYTGTACDACAPGFVAVPVGSTTTCQNVLPVTDARLTASWDAAAVSTLVLDGDRIDLWRQTHGSSWLWSVSDATRPRYRLLPPAVAFDGAADLWTSGYTLRDGDRYAIFAVVTWDPTRGRQTILDSWYPGDSSEAYALEAVDGHTVRFRHRGIGDPASDEVTSTAFDAAAGRQLVEVRRAPFLAGTALTISNGTTATAIAATRGPLTASPGAFVGRCFPAEPSCGLHGTVHELLFYDGALSSAERDAIVAYLKTKWSL